MNGKRFTACSVREQSNLETPTPVYWTEWSKFLSYIQSAISMFTLNKKSVNKNRNCNKSASLLYKNYYQTKLTLGFTSLLKHFEKEVRQRSMQHEKDF